MDGWTGRRTDSLGGWWQIDGWVIFRQIFGWMKGWMMDVWMGSWINRTLVH